jgi:dTDP-4-amino-4,6-dideoxygalactose transaminase
MSYLEKDEFVITRAELEEIEKLKEDKRKLIQTLEEAFKHIKEMKKIEIQHLEWIENWLGGSLSKFKQE